MLYSLPFQGKNRIAALGGPCGHSDFEITGDDGAGFTVRTRWQAETAAGEPVDPGELLGLPGTDGVTWDREAMETACIGYLECLADEYRWRTGPGTHYGLYKHGGSGRCQCCRRGVTYRVYAVKTVNGELWCQITPPPSCMAAGGAPALWVSAACGGHLARPVPAPRVAAG